MHKISGQALSDDEIDALSLGVGHYVPPKRVDKITMFSDLEQLNWKLENEDSVRLDAVRECT